MDGVQLLVRNATCINVTQTGDESITFEFSDGVKVKMYHHQDCCESVSLEDIAGGALSDLIGENIVEAYETSNSENPKNDYGESHTWTFYTIRTNKTTLTLRWYGSSNGYYSERVDVEQIQGD